MRFCRSRVVSRGSMAKYSRGAPGRSHAPTATNPVELCYARAGWRPPFMPQLAEATALGSDYLKTRQFTEELCQPLATFRRKIGISEQPRPFPEVELRCADGAFRPSLPRGSGAGHRSSMPAPPVHFPC